MLESGNDFVSNIIYNGDVMKSIWDKWGGRKNAGLWFGLIIPNFIVIGLAYLNNTELGFDFAKTFCLATLGGIIAYVAGNVAQTIGGGDAKK